MRRVQACIQQHGVLYVADCKMAALNTRAYVAAHQDYYLCPLPAVQMPKATLQALLEPVWTGEQPLAPVYTLNGQVLGFFRKQLELHGH